jgi:hemolysin-activating ACP:hemolysin acyltransferase
MFFGRKGSDEKAKVDARVRAREQETPAALIGNLSAVPELGDEEANRRMAAARHVSATFGEIVTLLMRTPQYRGISLGDLESLVVPPLLSGQVSIATAQSKNNGGTTPVGAILWARVSAEVAKRLASQAGKAIRLAPEEWQCGDIVWVVASAGESRVLSEMLKQLSRRDWAGKEVRIVVHPKDGKPTAATLVVQSSEAA